MISKLALYRKQPRRGHGVTGRTFGVDTLSVQRLRLVLLPEIAMTAALLDRFKARFGTEPTLWHSELTEKQRRIHWHAADEFL